MKGRTHEVWRAGKLRGYWNVHTGKLVYEDGAHWLDAVTVGMFRGYTVKPINFYLENK